MYNSSHNSGNRSQSRSFNRSSSRDNRARPSQRDFLTSASRSERPEPGNEKSSGNRSFGGERRSFDRGSNFNRRESRPSFGNRDSSFNRSERSPSGFGSAPRSSSSFGGGRSFGQSRGRFSGGRGGRGGRGAPKRLDENLFIQEAKPIEEQVAYVPTFVFNDLPVNNILLKNIAKKGFVDPTPIQDQSIMHVLDGKDLVGIANTGTGKTGAFLIPLIEKVLKGRHNKILILVPTRELAEQINEELYLLTRDLQVYSVKTIGGDNIERQIMLVRRGFNFIIGTPGRVEDLIERRVLNLSQFHTIVLDEVDRMLDMGFVDEIKEIIAMLPEDKQSLFFSATVDNKVEALMKTILKPDYVKVSVKTGITSHNIDQKVTYYSDFNEKLEKLSKVLDEYKDKKVLIFVNTKREVDKIDDYLFKEGYQVTSIHGDKRQSWRKKSIDKFKSGKANILVATDVAARGLDIPAVALVLNYDAPINHEDYIHRIGRTGRANQMGNAITFVKRNSGRSY